YGPAGRLFYSIGAEGRVTAYTFDSKEQLTEAITYTGKAYDLSGLAPSAMPAGAQIGNWIASLDDPTAVEQVR
ncbi:hypothetical protein, partial [Klebsiella aerogenes]